VARQTDSSGGASTASRVYLFTGESDSRRRDAVDELVHRLVNPSSEGFDLEIVDGEEASAASLLSSAATAPFESERKVVVVERTDRLSQDDQEKIAAFLPRLPAMSCLILLADASAKSKQSQSKAKEKEQEDEEEESQSKQKKGLSPALQRAVKAHGSVVTFAKMKSDQLGQAAAAHARRLGKKLDARSADALSRSVEGNALLLEREIEKLAIYVGERDTIVMADVEAVSSVSPEDRVFALVDAIGARKSGEAMRLLDETLASSPKPEGEVLRILAMMARHFRMLYQLRFLTESGIRNFGAVPEDIQELLPKEPSVLSIQDWQRKKLLPQLGCFTSEQLTRCLRGVLECELAAKGLGAETASNRLSLEMLLVRLCGLG
jgi:DNA polymerase-3 subunit delta